MKSAIARHARALWLAAILLTLGGVFAGLKMPVSLFPFISYPTVIVSIDAGERDAEQMAAQITRPIEVALRGVPGASRIRSTTSRGSAEVKLEFNWGHDMVSATLATQSALATLLPDLPMGTRFDVRRSDPTIFPVLGVALTSKSLDQEALRQIGILTVRPALLGVDGVAGVEILGGSPREFAVDIDPARAQLLGLSLQDVVTALGKANDVRGVGRLEDRHRLYLVLAQNRLATMADIAATPIKAGGASGAPGASGASSAAGATSPPTVGLATLGQIADIHVATAPNYTLVNADGQRAVLVNVRQALNGDTTKIVGAVKARLKTLNLPVTVKVTPFYDQSELVTGAANAVRDAILLGAVLAGVVLFAFLRSTRLMVITGFMLPAVLAGACVVLLAFGMSFNMMTLGGMAAAVGLIVDDAVVMLEHIMRRMQEGTAKGAKGILAAAAEMGRPLFGSTSATIIVFLPLAFITGVTGGFFKALALTMVAALTLSLLYARFVIPLVSAHWLREKDAEAAEKAGGFMGRLDHGYARVADRAFRRPALFAALLGVGMAVLGYAAWSHVPSGFMPHMDEGGFILDYKAQPGAALSDTDRLLRQVETIVTATPEVASYSRRTGLQLGGGLTEAAEGDYFINLKGGSRRSIDAVMAEIRQKIEAQVPGLTIETAQLMEDLIGDLTSNPQPIDVLLYGDNPATLATAAKQVGAAIGKIQGVVEVVDGLRVAGDAISIKINPGAATQQGLDPDTIATQLEALVGGTIATPVRIGEQLVAVRVRAPADLRSRAAELGRLVLTAPDGHAVRVDQIANVSIVAGQKQLTRENLAPYIGVTARLEGRDLGSAIKEVQSTVAGLNLPTSIRVEYGGLYAQQQKSFSDLAVVFAAALLLTALLLTFLFERLIWTLSAIVTVLLSAAAVLMGLWLTGIELDISALMGLTMVIGMVTELIIFLFAEIETDGPVDLAALREAASNRLRPILMSALIAILTLLPLALGLSRGSGLQKPLATAIIFGLTASVPLVLLFLPAMIAALSRRQENPPAIEQTA
ncbi:MAG: efflux RND transporter permease subunit [Pseudomonadota bacterium]|nr:efflux RND transporter permease subunit [Pseudomonadota bacterium]